MVMRRRIAAGVTAAILAALAAGCGTRADPPAPRGKLVLAGGPAPALAALRDDALLVGRQLAKGEDGCATSLAARH